MKTARQRDAAITKVIGWVTVGMLCASIGATAQAAYDRLDGPDSVPTPICSSEDSPSCWWVDPDTGTVYWNDADTGKADWER